MHTTDSLELSIVMPCLNEAETVETCVAKALAAMRQGGMAGEVVVADNGSTDGSQDLAREAGARVVHVESKGYGSALMGGIQATRGRYVIMGDADDSYDFTAIRPFVDKLRQGYDLVMGNRFKGGISPGAMPVLNRYLGNPVLTAVGRIFFRCPCSDFHCGLRGFSRQAILDLDLHSTGMEFASEMVIKATLHKLKVTEIPTTLSPDGRSRPPHLRRWRDGWRHLRFMLLYSPRWLFLYPGLALLLLGTALGLWLLPGQRTLFGVALGVHTMLFAALFVLVGFNAVQFAVFAKVFAISEGFLPKDPKIMAVFRYLTLERGVLAGGAVFLAGVALCLIAVLQWAQTSFGPIEGNATLRLVIPGVTLSLMGLQAILSSFFLSILGMRRR